MGLLGVADLTEGSLTPEQALERAETLVASAICPGLPGLDVRTWEMQVRLNAESRGYGVPGFGRRRLGPDVLKVWPITGLTRVTQEGVDVTAQCAFDTFSIRRSPSAPEFGAAGLIEVQFTTGWTLANVPPAIRQAVVATARGVLEDVPAGVKAEKIGDHTITYQDAPSGAKAFPVSVLHLLAPWRVYL